MHMTQTGSCQLAQMQVASRTLLEPIDSNSVANCGGRVKDDWKTWKNGAIVGNMKNFRYILDNGIDSNILNLRYH